MEPSRDDEDAVVDLLDVLLEEGVLLQADVVINVADVPLVGVQLRAALAGMTTMTEYGLLTDFDAAVRERGLERQRTGSERLDEGRADDERLGDGDDHGAERAVESEREQ